MNTPTNQPSEELRQQLWELAYGLLDDEAEAGLRAQIKSDPAVARLYAEVRLQSDLVAAASRVEDSSLNISAGPDSKSNSKSNISKTRDRAHHQHAASRSATGNSWVTNWLAVGGTVALLVLLTFGLMRPDATNATVAQVDEFFYTKFSAPAEMTQGLSPTVEIETKNVDGNGRATELQVRLVDGAGRETYRNKVSTNANGLAQVQLPGDVLTPGTRLEVHPAAEDTDGERGISAELKITEEEPRTVMLLEKPFAQPGDKVGFSMLGVKRFSKKTQLPDTDQLMVEDRSGGAVVQPMWTSDPESGVISGEFELPEDAALKQLAMRRQQQPLSKGRPESSASETKQNTIASIEQLYLGANRARDSRLKDEASVLQRSLAMQPPLQDARSENLRKSASSEPAAKPGEVAANLNDAVRGLPEEVPAAAFGSGNKPQAKAFSPGAAGPVAASPPAPPAPALPGPGFAGPVASRGGEGPSALTDGRNLVPKDSTIQTENQPSQRFKESQLAQQAAPVEFAPQAASAPQAGVVVARQGDRVIARRKLSAQTESGKAALQLPPEVEGVVTLEYYSNADADQPAYREQIVQQSDRQLQIEVAGLKDGYLPNEQVRLQLRVVDEQARPVTANVGVRVWHERAVATTRVPLSLAEALALESEPAEDDVAAPEAVALAGALPAMRGSAPAGPVADAAPGGGPGQGAADAQGANNAQEKRKAEEVAAGISPAEPASAPPAAESFSKQQVDALERDAKAESLEVERLHEYLSPDVVQADNQAQVQRDYDLAVAATRLHANDRWQGFGRVLVWSAAGLLLIVGLLLIARQPIRTAVLVPAVSVSVICLVMGIAWFVPTEPMGMDIAWNAPKDSGPVATTAEFAATPASESHSFGAQPANELASQPAEFGERPAANEEVKDSEFMQRQERTIDVEAGQGGGGFTPPMATPAPALQPAQPTAESAAADFKADAQNGALAANRSEANSREPLREADKMRGNKLEAAKGGSDLALGNASQRPAGAPGTAGRGFSGGAAPAGSEAKKTVEDERALNRASGATLGGEIAPPDSIFWRPLSPTESDGSITIEFTMPAVESEYVLLIDAIGNGRLGHKQQLLICREPK